MFAEIVKIEAFYTVRRIFYPSKLLPPRLYNILYFEKKTIHGGTVKKKKKLNINENLCTMLLLLLLQPSSSVQCVRNTVHDYMTAADGSPGTVISRFLKRVRLSLRPPPAQRRCRPPYGVVAAAAA